MRGKQLWRLHWPRGRDRPNLIRRDLTLEYALSLICEKIYPSSEAPSLALHSDRIAQQWRR